ncbi:MAG: flagellar motor protein MotB [Candidatus Magnetoovum sp. WYHC-5]|nr:flagellar motor protein MotB [Candidatus Magnetoovum sp. WYHC-5]
MQDNTDDSMSDDFIKTSKVSLYRRVIARSKSSSDDDIWLITLSDLMSLLLVCFIMFFVIAKNQKVNIDLNMTMANAAEMDVQSRLPGLSAMNTDILYSLPALPETAKGTATDEVKEYASTVERIKKELDMSIQALKLEEKVTTSVDDNDLIIRMKEDVTFNSASAELIDDAKPILDSIAQIINENKSCIVEIDGHTDNLPIKTPLYPSNFELSLARATSVVDFFTQAKGIDEKKFFVRGNSDLRPITSNDAPENRAKNRRVEIRLRTLDTDMAQSDNKYNIDDFNKDYN